MIQFSYETVLMALISTNFIAVIMTLCFCNKKFLLFMDCRMFSIFLGIVILRLVIPVKFSFASAIVLPASLSQAAAYVSDFFFIEGSLNISLCRFIEFVWVIGSIICLVMLIRERIVFKRMITSYDKYVKNVPFRIVEISGLSAPMMSGILSPCILVPEGIDHDGIDFRSLLVHKANNYFHRDILTNVGVDLLTIIFWWSPVCYMLRTQLSVVSETRELVETQFSESLADRFRIMGRKRMLPLHIAVLAVMIAICLLSYCFVFIA